MVTQLALPVPQIHVNGVWILISALLLIILVLIELLNQVIVLFHNVLHGVLVLLA